VLLLFRTESAVECSRGVHGLLPLLLLLLVLPPVLHR
jgi:hypothetical protein